MKAVTYVTVVTCADTLTFTLCCLMNYYSDICHLLISGVVSVNIATDILCESDGCHCKLPVSR